MEFVYITLIIYSLVVLWVCALIIYEKKEPVKALAWIVVITFIPVVGIMIYIPFGQNHRKRKLFYKKLLDDVEEYEHEISRQLYKVNSPLFKGEKDAPLIYRDIQTLLLNNNKTPISRGNHITYFDSGKKCFDALKEALRGAKKFIHIEYYIYLSDTIGTEIAQILMEKAKNGVEVRFIYDSVGSLKLSSDLIKQMKSAGVDVQSFMPVIFPLFTSKINYRNHRKIVVVDGEVGFTGGVNVADKYIHGTKKMGAWRDVHLQIEGSAVESLNRVFIADWEFVSSHKLDHKSDYLFSSTYESGSINMQIASSGPDSNWASIMQAFFAAITRAKDYIYIVSPYFTPNQPILTALKVAALSGMDVRIIIPRMSDSKLVYWATRSYITELLEAGVRVYLYHGGFIHSKMLMADGAFCSVGSANMDIRSFEDNFEVTAFIYDSEECKKVEAIFFEDLTHSREVVLDSWKRRRRRERLYESLSRLLSPLL